MYPGWYKVAQDTLVVQRCVEYHQVPPAHCAYLLHHNFIVAWRDGRVSLVPLPDVRMLEKKPKEWVFVFPGMSNYDSELPRYMGMEPQNIKDVPKEVNQASLGLG